MQYLTNNNLIIFQAFQNKYSAKNVLQNIFTKRLNVQYVPKLGKQQKGEELELMIISLNSH